MDGVPRDMDGEVTKKGQESTRKIIKAYESMRKKDKTQENVGRARTNA